MKVNKEFYQVKIKIYYKSHNAMRGFETNDIEEAKKRFADMESFIKNKNSEWLLQLNKVRNNSIIPIKVTSSNGNSYSSPLF